VNILAVSLATYLLIGWFGGHRAEVISTLVMAPIVLIFGEIIPKMLFQQKADELTPWVAPPLAVFSVLLGPLVSASVVLSARVLKFFGVRSPDHKAMLTRSELYTLIREARREGAVDFQRGGMMEEVIDLRQTLVRDVMEPFENHRQLGSGGRRTPRAYDAARSAGIPGPVLRCRRRALSDVSSRRPPGSAHRGFGRTGLQGIGG